MSVATYPSHYQDFMGENLTMLDSWVFDYLSDMARKKELPVSRETVIFLHLLATDTIGHSAKPESEYEKISTTYNQYIWPTLK